MRSTATTTPRAWPSPASSSSGRWPCGWPTGWAPAAARWTSCRHGAPWRSASRRRSRSCPGISRSGATITAGLALGLNREAAARFSFLLATPITLGAGLYGSRRLLTEGHTQVEWLAIGVGFVVAALSGLIAIGFLLAWLRTRSVTVFSVYRIGFAAVIVLLVATGR